MSVAAASAVISTVARSQQQVLVLRLSAAGALLYLASTTLVTLVEGQPGQLALSALWGVVGVAALLGGIARDAASLRACALWLLAIAAGKVFVVDLASLDSMARVGSFLVLGTLLLAGAFAWQRARPAGPGS